MKIKENKTQELINKLNTIIDSANELEKQFAKEISLVHPDLAQSAKNLVHYMALRQHNINEMQETLRDMGLTPFDHIEPHVMRSLLITKVILQRLIGEIYPISERKTLSPKKSRKILNNNTRQLFGRKSKKRRTRIMVTMPFEISQDIRIPGKFVKAGMNCARINCAHDNKEVWDKMITNIRLASKKARKKTRIMMDLGGPKLRTGPMISGPKVIHIKPERDDLGNVTKPAMLWLASPDVLPPGEADAIIPVNAAWLKNVKRGDVITFADSRKKKCTLKIIKKQGEGKWAICYDSTYISTGTDLILKKETHKAEEIVAVGELLPLEQFVLLKPGDNLVLHKDMNKPGESAKYDQHGKLLEPAHITCTMPEIFADVKPSIVYAK